MCYLFLFFFLDGISLKTITQSNTKYHGYTNHKKENYISLWNKTATFERSICQLPSVSEGVDQTKRTFLKSISTQIYGNNVLVYSKSLFSIFCKTTLPVILTKSVRTSNNIFQKSVLRHNKSSSSNRHFVPENTWV